MTVTCFVRSRHGISSLSEEKREREREREGEKENHASARKQLLPRTSLEGELLRRPSTTNARIFLRGERRQGRETLARVAFNPRVEGNDGRNGGLFSAVVNALESWLTLTRGTGNGVETGSDGDVFPEREAVNPSSRRSWTNNGRRAWLLRGCRRHCRKQRLGNP